MNKNGVRLCLAGIAAVGAVGVVAMGGCGSDNASPPQVGLPGGPVTADQITRGRYLVVTAGCADCHSQGNDNPGDPNWLDGYINSRTLNPADQGKFTIGPPTMTLTVYAPNLTPDTATGLGSWTPQNIFNALRLGKDKDGNTLCPPMPWPSFRNFTDSDIYSIVAYLRSIKAVTNTVPEATGANMPAGQHPDCSMFYANLQPVPAYPAANETTTRKR